MSKNETAKAVVSEIQEYLEFQDRPGTYKLDRHAETRNGKIDLAQLRNDEVLVSPGLIYKRFL
jgi:hypothetical protein